MWYPSLYRVMLIASFSCFFILSALGQTSLLDSLKRSLKLEQPDTNTFNLLNDICWELESLEAYDSLLPYALKMQKLSARLDYEKGQASAYYKTATAYWHLGNYPEAAASCDSALLYFDRAGDPKKMMHTAYLKGMILGDQGKYEEAMPLYYSAIKKAQSLKDSLAEGAILNSVALVHKWMSQYDRAEEAFMQSIEILNGEATEYRRALSMTNLGYLYIMLEKYEEALTLSHQALALFQKWDSEWGVASNKGNIGACLLKMGLVEESLPYLESHLEYEKENDPKSHAGAIMMLADARQASGELERAGKMYQQALEISVGIGALDYQRQLKVALSENAARRNDYYSAFQHLQQATQLSDTLYSRQTADKVTELAEKFEVERKENQIALLSMENQLKETELSNEANIRKGLLIGLGLVFILGFVVWNGQRKAIKNQRVLDEKNQEILKREYQQALVELELKALRAQMNPHFIFNCMNSINRLILEEKNEEAARLLTKFSRLIRLILEHSGKKKISLQQELDLLETYIHLEARRFDGSLDYQVHLEIDEDMEFIEIPSMILQPFVENAILHGLLPRTDKSGCLKLVIQQKEKSLLCSIEDNGVGREKAKELKENSILSHKSMAMKVTESRLQLLNGIQSEQLVQVTDLVDAQARPCGTRVEVEIPI